MEDNLQIENQNQKRKHLYILGPIILLIVLVGVTYAIFNYTRTGTANVISVGKIAFNSNQTETVNLINVFPIDSDNVSTDTTNVDEALITITGDTTYSDGVEYLLTATDVSNTIGTGNNQKTIPVSIQVTATSGLGTSDEDYFTNRGGNSSVYKVLSGDEIKNNGQLVVGYIATGQTGVNGSVTIKAYLDKDKIGISDTYDGEESETNGTTNEWADDRTILTTSEWNSLQTNGVSFKVKVEANEGVWVDEPLTGTQMVQRAILAKQEAETNSCNPVWIDDNGTANDETDDITYFSGDNDCVDMNYVWYSGKLWRITAIYPDGAMKLITQNMITSIAFNAAGQVTNANTTYYMYQWLNEDFYDTLYNANGFIDTSKQWNATMPADTNVGTKPLETNMVTANVGLLNNYEYYNSYRCIGSSTCTGSSYSTGYLNIGYYWWLLNPYNALGVWHVYNGGSGGSNLPSNTNGARPSIYLKSGLEFTGDGSKQSPYKIVGDKDTGAANELVNTRISGEYVKLKNGNNEQLFRIIGVEDNKTKIIAMDYADNKATKKFATSTGSENTLWGTGTTIDTDTWYTYLNDNSTGYLKNLKDTYGELFDSGLYYLGTSGYNYKLSVCAYTTSGNTKTCDKTSDKGIFNIGLPRYGEMFATQQSGGYSNSINMWLINRFSTTRVWYVSNNGYAYSNYPTNTYGVRPTLHLKSGVRIISGTGTETDPYVVGISN